MARGFFRYLALLQSAQFAPLASAVVPSALHATLADVPCEVQVRVEVPGEIAYRHVVLRTVAAVCKVAIKHVCGRDVSASGFTHQVVSAVGEAFNNIAAHCYRDQATDIVRIAMTIETDRLVVTLEDCGPSFDPLTARLPDIGSLPESGLGVFIMRSMMDQVSYRPGRPNRLILSKRIRECPAGLPHVGGRRASDGLFKE